MPLRPERLVAAAALIAACAVAAPCAAADRCATWVVVDGLADPGTLQPAGAVLDVNAALPPDQNAQVVGGIGPSAFLGDVTVDPSRAIYVADIEADPSGLGPDANGNPGPGALFVLDGAGALVLVSDGGTCGPTIPACPPGGAFVDPLGLAYDRATSMLVVADLDADPSALGRDSHGFAGHGAVYAVDLASGRVDLVADGSSYAGVIPRGRPSIFEDPLAVTVARDGTLYVVDQLATPLIDQAITSPGAVFRVDRASGLVTAVAVIPRSAGLRDVAVEPSGTLLVLDRVADGGTIFRVDPSGPPPLNVIGSFPLPPLVDAQGIVVEGDGTIAVIDASADPLDTSTGALFTIDPAFTGTTPVSASPLFVSPWGLDLLYGESIDSATPATGAPGTSLTVRLRGGLFDPDATVSFGPAVTVDAVRVVDATTIDVDITIPAGPPQLVDVSVANVAARTQAFHCELFEIAPGLGCAPTSPVGDTLRVRRADAATLLLTWDGTGDPCTAGYRMRRSLTPHPAILPGTWPSDPAFADITSADGDASPIDTRFEHAATADPLECFLVTEVGTNGAEGPSGHYGG